MRIGSGRPSSADDVDAIEHAGTVCSNDRDFGRFEGLRWNNPLD